MKLSTLFKTFPFYKQLDSMDCGPSCLRMIAKHYGKNYSIQYLREQCYIDKAGVSLKGIAEAAERIGFRTLAVKIPIESNDGKPCLKDAALPCILHWNQNHFVVLYKIKNDKFYIADPGSGRVKLKIEDFKESYVSDNRNGIALLVETTPDFYEREANSNKSSYRFLIDYIKPYKKLLIQLVLGLLLGTVFQLIFPFLTQSIVDIGIETQNISFIYLILIGQLMIFVSQTAVRFIQSWILLHISVRMNVSLISDFLIKLMKLPLGFFDSKNIGDLMQRIGDHDRIRNFLTNSSLSFILSSLNILVFGIVLLIYSFKIFLVFLIASVLYVSWIFIFLKRRKKVDHQAFQQMSENQQSLIEIIHGMPEIKLQGSEFKRRWQWTSIQAKLFRVQMKSLSIGQYQDAGALFINQLKDILITVLAATSVIRGEITLGAMLAIQYIIGQLNSPLQQMIGFIRSGQDALISLERLSEIHDSENEELEEEVKVDKIPEEDITIENLSFSYTPISEDVLKNINLKIPKNKTTAIVGVSGSGKTTIIKLLLGFYSPNSGTIKIGYQNLSSIYRKVWRDKCGVVLQSGYIFSDTIARNIAESDDYPIMDKVIEAARTANIASFIENLPLSYKTMIGEKGNDLSQGQKQRILIARAVYKDPDFIFFDEATNALDANNEKEIVQNLNTFFENKTVVVVAHRLSTVKNADQIIVLDDGAIAESGTHDELIELRDKYYKLVKNQLELGT